MAANRGLVEHVVVDQRGRVDHFYGGRQEHVGRTKAAQAKPLSKTSAAADAFRRGESRT